ncbi:MAG: nucleotide exchange factor GrpE [Lentisphaerae bacterium]|nr:nucleotide exchange factor GrpE [Lentisphaerota bacterium]
MKGSKSKNAGGKRGKEAGKEGHSKGAADAPGKGAAEGRKAGEKKADPVESPESSCAALEEQLLRLRADFDNFRKRTLREKGEIYSRANEEIMLEMLPVLDHIDLALAAAHEHGTAGAVVEGFRLVAEQFRAVLGKFGLAVVDAEGLLFDPNLHEAVSHLASADVPEDVVMTQVRRGYRLGEMLLRPAQTVVSSGPSGEDAAEEGT